jgi:hypothetical protein
MSGDHNMYCAANQPKEKDKQAEKQEPVAYINYYDSAIKGHKELHWGVDNASSKTTPLYTAPPKREWVSLTDEEIHDEALKLMRQHKTGHLGIARAVEAKLKEKNT